jgi:hypothetical protein
MFTKDQFIEQTKNHKLTVIKDDGLYRHLRVSIPGYGICESWNIHTWPGYLAMVGDMGDWVFQRTEDMLCFFRNRKGELSINPMYWAEKLQAQEREGFEAFSIDRFHKQIEECAIEACEVETFEDVPKNKKDDLWSLLNSDDEYEAVSAVRDFDCDWLSLDDFWEHDCKEIRDRFLFACYAIAWTVILYDLQRDEKSWASNGV